MKYLILVPVIYMSLSSCKQAELNRSNQERDSLMTVVNEREKSINEFISSFNDVESNLDSVTLKQHLLSVNARPNSELKQNQKEHINSQIAAINSLMEENRKKLAELNRKLKGSLTKNIQMEKIIATLDTQLVHKYVELIALNEKLYALNGKVERLQISVDTLTLQNTMKAQTISSNIRELHSAYYRVGKTRDLQKAQLIDKKGGLLGIGRTEKLNGNFDTTRFTRIDYTQTTRISINSEKANIISSHPSDSYLLEKEKKRIKFLVITDPEKFWSISKYLVIVND